MASSGLEVYGMPLSQPTRAVLWALEMKSVPYTLRRVNPMKGEAASDEFLKLFPTGLVPGIVDGDLRLSEAGAILVYLAEKHGWDDWYPKGDAAKRARINQWLHWHHAYPRQITMKLVGPLFFARVMGTPLDEPALAKMKKATTRVLKEMELVMRFGGLKDHKFLCGDEPTLADVLIYCEVDQFAELDLPVSLEATAPTVAAWATRMRQLPKHDEVRADLAKIRKVLSASKL
jgi:glutathione S-transferase